MISKLRHVRAYIHRFLLHARAYLRRVPAHYWAWIFAFVSLGGGWGHAIFVQPPPSYTGQVDPVSIATMGVSTLLGAAVGIVGILITVAQKLGVRLVGLWIELVGTVLLMGGPLQYCLLQVGFLYSGQFDQRYALAWFAEAMTAFVIVRFAYVIPHIWRDMRKSRIPGDME